MNVSLQQKNNQHFPTAKIIKEHFERMRGSNRHRRGSESQTKQKSVSRLVIEPRSSDLRSDALPIKLLRPTPWPHHSTSFSSHCRQRHHCHLSGCSDTNSAWLPAPDTRKTLFLPGGELSSRLRLAERRSDDLGSIPSRDTDFCFVWLSLLAGVCDFFSFFH